MDRLDCECHRIHDGCSYHRSKRHVNITRRSIGQEIFRRELNSAPRREESPSQSDCADCPNHQYALPQSERFTDLDTSTPANGPLIAYTGVESGMPEICFCWANLNAIKSNLDRSEEMAVAKRFPVDSLCLARSCALDPTDAKRMASCPLHPDRTDCRLERSAPLPRYCVARRASYRGGPGT